MEIFFDDGEAFEDEDIEALRQIVIEMNRPIPLPETITTT